MPEERPPAVELPEIVAVYRERSDGDWDFVAAFARPTMPLLSQAEKCQTDVLVKMLSDAIKEEGDAVKIEEMVEPNMPSVWSKF